MNIVTGYTGSPHITSAQDRAGNQGAIGTGSYILNVGNKLEPTIVSATEIRIQDGAVCHQGCIGVIDFGGYDSITVANGSQGMNRADLIVCRYTKNSGTNEESLDLVCIQGTAVSGVPTLPTYNTGNIQEGDSPVDMPLFRVNISGTSISSVEQVALNVMTQAETDVLIGNTALGATTITGAVVEYGQKLSQIGHAGLRTSGGSSDYGTIFANQGTTLVTTTIPANNTTEAIVYRVVFSVAICTNYSADKSYYEISIHSSKSNSATNYHQSPLAKSTTNYVYEQEIVDHYITQAVGDPALEVSGYVWTPVDSYWQRAHISFMPVKRTPTS